MKKNLSIRVREVASTKLNGKYNLKPFANDPIKLHHNVCKELVSLSDKYNFPMGVLVYIAVGTDAHKTPVFEGGYKKINVEKAEKVIELCDLISTSFNLKGLRTNGNIVHACDRFYKLGGTKEKLQALINGIKEEDIKTAMNINAKTVTKLLFSSLKLNEKGYLESVTV